MSKKNMQMNNLISYFVDKDKILDEKMYKEIKKNKSIHNKIVEIGNKINITKLTPTPTQYNKKKKIVKTKNCIDDMYNGVKVFILKFFYDLKFNDFLDKTDNLKDKKKFFFIMCPGSSPSKLVAFMNIVYKKELNKYNLKFVQFNVSSIKKFYENEPKLLEKIIMDSVEKTRKENKIKDKLNIYFGFYDAIFSGKGIGIINKFLKKNEYSTIKDIDSKKYTFDLLPSPIKGYLEFDNELPFLIIAVPGKTMFDVSELDYYKYNKKKYHSRCTKYAGFNRSRNRYTDINGITFCNIIIYYSILKYKKEKNIFKLNTLVPIPIPIYR